MCPFVVGELLQFPRRGVASVSFGGHFITKATAPVFPKVAPPEVRIQTFDSAPEKKAEEEEEEEQEVRENGFWKKSSVSSCGGTFDATQPKRTNACYQSTPHSE